VKRYIGRAMVFSLVLGALSACSIYGIFSLPDMQVAYGLSGTRCFTFDRATRVLSRRAAWW